MGHQEIPRQKTLSWPLEVKMGSLQIKLFLDRHLDKDIEKEMICDLAENADALFSFLFLSWVQKQRKGVGRYFQLAPWKQIIIYKFDIIN